MVEISQLEVLTEPASAPSPKVKVLLAVKAPLAVNPEVAVMSPDMVGMAVQAVGEMVNPDPAMVVA